MTNAAKLSQMQKWLLTLLLDDHEHGEKSDLAFKAARPEMRACHNATAIWGVSWQPKKRFPELTQVQSVNISRALARLEARGMLIRQSRQSGTPDSHSARHTHESTPPTRCDHVLLTALGRETANKIKKNLLAVCE